MNFYPFHIGDYLARTGHLEPMEDLAYRRMIDLYYLNEGPLPADVGVLASAIRMSSHLKAIESVLQDFFSLTTAGWHHKGCEIELAAYRKAKANHWTKKLTKAQRAEMAGARRARKINASPPWIDAKHRKQIAEIYAQAALMTASTGVPHEVDHIVPLCGELVCGLHVVWNLRVITAEENRRKGNRVEAA